jgi:hypothetical protein
MRSGAIRWLGRPARQRPLRGLASASARASANERPRDMLPLLRTDPNQCRLTELTGRGVVRCRSAWGASRIS